jgi:hypothetical protein
MKTNMSVKMHVSTYTKLGCAFRPIRWNLIKN